MDYLLLGVFGSFGAILRFWVSKYSLISKDIFPFSTLTINLFGCFLAGLVLGLSEKSSYHHYYLLFLIGFVGSFTTFSAFSMETISLISNKQPLLAGLNIVLNITGSLVLLWFGKVLTS